MYFVPVRINALSFLTRYVQYEQFHISSEHLSDMIPRRSASWMAQHHDRRRAAAANVLAFLVDSI